MSIRRHAHTIKGSAANLSAGALRSLALQAEQPAKAGELTSVAEIITTIEREFERAKQAMTRSGWE